MSNELTLDQILGARNMMAENQFQQGSDMIAKAQAIEIENTTLKAQVASLQEQVELLEECLQGFADGKAMNTNHYLTKLKEMRDEG